MMNILIIQALAYASEIHAKQRRKASIIPGSVPYLAHLMEVAGIVYSNGGNDEVVSAALLHDAIEDQAATINDIASHVPVAVAQLVYECTEIGVDGLVKAPWKERKEAYLAHIPNLSPEALLISVADKLQNIRSLRHQVRIDGDEAYAHFTRNAFATVAERKEAVLWFYEAAGDAFRAHLTNLLYDGYRGFHDGIEALIRDLQEVVEILKHE